MRSRRTTHGNRAARPASDAHDHSRAPARHPGRRTRRLLGLVAAISMTAVLAACSASDGGSDASDDSSRASRLVRVARTPAEGGGVRQRGRQRVRRRGRAGPEHRRDRRLDRPAPTGRPSRRAARHLDRAPSSLTSDDVREARRDVQRVVDASGGDVTEEQTDTDEDGELSTRGWCVRVPAGPSATR